LKKKPKPIPVPTGVRGIEVNTDVFFTTNERWRNREELLGWVRRQAARAGFTISTDKYKSEFFFCDRLCHTNYCSHFVVSNYSTIYFILFLSYLFLIIFCEVKHV